MAAGPENFDVSKRASTTRRPLSSWFMTSPKLLPGAS
jgi:hypothetical protein